MVEIRSINSPRTLTNWHDQTVCLTFLVMRCSHFQWQSLHHQQGTDVWLFRFCPQTSPSVLPVAPRTRCPECSSHVLLVPLVLCGVFTNEIVRGWVRDHALHLSCCLTKVSEMYFMKMRPRTTCLYSPGSICALSLSAVFQSVCLKSPATRFSS